MKRGRRPPSASPQKRRKLNPMEEEILSSDSDAPLEERDDFFEADEAPEETRHRLAKELLKQAQEIAEDDPDKVQEILQNAAVRFMQLEQKGRLMIPIADQMPQESPQHFFKGHILTPTCIALSWNGETVATGGRDCSIIICKDYIGNSEGEKVHLIKGFRKVQEGPGHTGDVMALHFSEDQKFLASGGKDRILKIWDGNTFELLRTFKGHRDTITCLKFARNSHTLFTGSADRVIKIWNISDMVYMNSLFGHVNVILDMDSMINDRAISTGYDGTVRIWKLMEESQLVFSTDQQSIDCVRVLTNETFVTGSMDGSLQLWNINRRKPVFVLPGDNESWVVSMAILRSSDLLAVATTDGFIGFYKVGGNQIIFKHKIFIGGYINALEFTRNGRQLYAVIGKDHKLGRWLPTHKVKSGLLRIDINLPFAGEEVDMLKWK